MSKNEFLNAVSVYLDELAKNQGGLSDEKLKEIIAHEIESQLYRYCVVSEDDLDDKIDEKIEDAFDNYDFDRPIEAYLRDCDFVSRDDLDNCDFVSPGDLDCRLDEYVDYHELINVDELDERLEDYATFDSLADSVQSALDERGVGALLDTLFGEVEYLKSRIAILELEKVIRDLDALVK